MGLEDRLKRLRQKFTEAEIDALFISQPENRRYLSGFDGSAGYLLITPRDVVLATDFRYLEQAKGQAPQCQVFQIGGDIGDWFPRLLSDLDLEHLGFEAGHISFSLYRKLSDTLSKAKLPIRLIPGAGLVEGLRAVKEAEEIEFIAQASAISDAAFEYAENTIRPGLSEQELAWEIEKFMRERGSEATPFDVVVASGENSALPHAKPTPRQFALGEPIVIDIGAKVAGYSSDLTRTICLGTQGDTFSKIYDIVQKALTEILSEKELKKVSRRLKSPKKR